MTAAEDSDEMLVQRALAGDRAGFATLVTRHYDLMFRVAWKWCGNREDAEDIAQDVCIRLGRALSRYDGRSRFTTWLYQVVLNASRDHHRRQESDKRKLANWQNEPNRATHQPAQAGQTEDPVTELWQAVRNLPARQCDAVMLVYGEELTHSEAAKVMKCAEGTVASNIHDAKKSLKRLLLLEASI